MDTWPTAGQDREWTQTTKGQGHRGADTGGQWQFQQSPSCTADRQKEEAEKGRERERQEEKNPRMLNQSVFVETSGTAILCIYE